MAYKKTKKTVAEEFNMDDWVSAKPMKMISGRKSFNEDQIRVAVKHHSKKKDYYFITFGFRKKLLAVLDKSQNMKIIIMKHKNGDSRLMLTKSDNGYTVTKGKASDYYFFKSLIYAPTGLQQTSHALNPIFHPKSPNNSGAIFELKIPQVSQ